MRFFKPVILNLLFSFLFPVLLLAQRNDGAVIPGDFADPSIIRVGNMYYAVGTSSEWAPHYPIYQSNDLKHWRQSGYVFDKTPAWSSGSFWAPEYHKIKDTYYIYYTARRKSDNTSYIAVATSRYPDKGFTDHGVLVEFGKEAIDPFIFNDNGQLYISFKAYGLDNRPIELLASKLSADGLKLEGETFSLLTDAKREGMEGQSILKKDGYYYLFYSAGNCCGTGCSYNVRVARAKSFAGPYEVYSANPILSENGKWKCMGHGTFVKGPNGGEYYLHHAYNRESTVFTGRQGLISELIWPKTGEWPRFKTQEVSGPAAADITETFSSSVPAKYWQWDFRNSTPRVKQQKGVLHLGGSIKPGNQAGIVLTSRPVSGSFAMTTTVINHNTAIKGLSFYGDANQALGFGTQGNEVVIWQVRDHKFTADAKAAIDAKLPIQLKLEVIKENICRFYYRQRKGSWKELVSPKPVTIDGLPQWDRAPRAGLHFKGDEKDEAEFSGFSILNK